MGQTQGSQSGSYRRQTSGSQSLPSGGFVGQIGPTLSSVSLARSTSPPEDERVPVMFKWTHGGQRVYVTGTFNNWAKEGIPMVRSGQEFYQIVDVSKGVHEYKFLVDGEWKFSHEQPVLQDTGGNVNNVVDIQYYEKYEPAPLKDPLEIVEFEGDAGEFKNEMIDHPVQTSEPPSAPPLLVKLPLLGLPAHQRSEVCKLLSSNISPSQVNIPLFSVCGHVMHDATSSFSWISSDAVVCASTIRFAQKFSTNVLVTLNNSTRTDAFAKLYGFTESSAPHAFERIFGGSPKPRETTTNLRPSVQLCESKSRGNIDISYFTD
jgi:hypothetical protein